MIKAANKNYHPVNEDTLNWILYKLPVVLLEFFVKELQHLKY